MIPAIGRRCLPFEIGERPREDIQVMRQPGREERQLEIHSAARETVNAARRQHLQPHLIEESPASPLASDHLVGLAIDPHKSSDAVRLAGPMPSAFVVQTVGHRPDTEVRIVGHQRDCRGPHGRKLLPECRKSEGIHQQNRSER